MPFALVTLPNGKAERKEGGRGILICAIERFSIWDRELVGLVDVIDTI